MIPASQEPHKVKFLKRRWVIIIGVVPMLIYTFLASVAVYATLTLTIFRPPNIIFPMTDLIGWMGYFSILGLIFISGIKAVKTAHYMGGVYRILYLAGIAAMLASASYLPLSIFYDNTKPYSEPAKCDDVTGRWMKVQRKLQLLPDSTFVLVAHRDFFRKEFTLGMYDPTEFTGSWSLDRHRLTLTSATPKWSLTWSVISSQGYCFIRTEFPENPDAWSGDLGFMRETDWMQTH